MTKKKLLIAIVSVALNLVLFAALFHYDKMNKSPVSVSVPVFRLQNLSVINHLQSDHQGIALASMVK